MKFCRVAEGIADHYPRLAPTHDWDMAAGHAILAAAGGGSMAPDGAPLVYGTSELLVPAFLAWAATPRQAVSANSRAERVQHIRPFPFGCAVMRAGSAAKISSRSRS